MAVAGTESGLWRDFLRMYRYDIKPGPGDRSSEACVAGAQPQAGQTDRVGGAPPHERQAHLLPTSAAHSPSRFLPPACGQGVSERGYDTRLLPSEGGNVLLASRAVTGRGRLVWGYAPSRGCFHAFGVIGFLFIYALWHFTALLYPR